MENRKVKERERQCILFTCSFSLHIHNAAHPHRHRVLDIRHHAEKLQEQLQKEMGGCKIKSQSKWRTYVCVWTRRPFAAEIRAHADRNRIKRKNVTTKCTSKRSGVVIFQEWCMKMCVIKVSVIYFPIHHGHLKLKVSIRNDTTLLTALSLPKTTPWKNAQSCISPITHQKNKKQNC